MKKIMMQKKHNGILTQKEDTGQGSCQLSLSCKLSCKLVTWLTCISQITWSSLETRAMVCQFAFLISPLFDPKTGKKYKTADLWFWIVRLVTGDIDSTQSLRLVPRFFLPFWGKQGQFFFSCSYYYLLLRTMWNTPWIHHVVSTVSVHTCRLTCDGLLILNLILAASRCNTQLSPKHCNR